MSISSRGAWSSSKVRKPPSREEPSARYLTICQCPGAMRYWHTNSGSPASTPTRQSNSVGRNFCASSRSVSSNSSSAMRLNSAWVSTLCTPRENEPSGIFTTSGRPSSSIALVRSESSATITVGGVGTWFWPSSSLRNTLLVQRIIDDRHALLPGAAREPVGVVVDRGGLADEQPVVFRELGELAARHRLDVDRQLLGDASHVLDRGRRGRRHLLVGVVEHREVVFRNRARSGISPFALGVLMERLAQEGSLAVGEPGDVARTDPIDREPGAGLYGHLQRRAAEPIEQEPPELLEARVAGDAEADQQLGLALGLVVGAPRAAIELVLELGQRVLVELDLAQLQHGLDIGHDAVPARLRQQRGIVAFRLVGVGSRQVDELRPSHVEQARTGEIFARRDHLVRGFGVRKVFGLVDQNDPAGHEGPFRMTMAALSRSRPRWVTRSNAVHGTA